MTIISHRFNTILSRVNQFMDSNQGNIWFRGHSNIGNNTEQLDYKLTSSLFRVNDNLEKIKELENNYFYEFMTKGYSIHQTKNQWDLLYLMQHHGTPTRLLDWTMSFSIALYFATRNWDPKKNTPTIWFLNPEKLNEALSETSSLLIPSGDYFKFISQKELPSMAIAPTYNSARLIAQQGQFTLQGNTVNDLEEELKTNVDFYGDILDNITLDKDIFNDVISYLHMNGINDFTVFPDLDGLSKLVSKRRL